MKAMNHWSHQIVKKIMNMKAIGTKTGMMILSKINQIKVNLPEIVGKVAGMSLT